MILDRETDKPIEGVNVVYTSKDYAITNAQGYFELSGITVKSDEVNKSGMGFLSSSILIHKKDYKDKSYYSYRLPIMESEYGYYKPRYINMSDIYLERKTSNSDEKEDVIEKMTFCQPNESQKEVNYIPQPVTTE